MLRAPGARVGWKPGVSARWLGLAEIVLAGQLVAMVTPYHLRNDSGTAAVVWLYSFSVALLFLALPGIVLGRTRCLRWALQVLPVALSLWFFSEISSARW